jgi:rhodanese-related sulfurtransferase
MNIIYGLSAIVILGVVGLAAYFLGNRSAPAATPITAITQSLPQAQTITQISVTHLQTDDGIVLDVREPWEYEAGHVPGSVLIPLGELGSRLQELPNGEAIYIICRSGNRSQQAAQLLVRAGFAHIHNVQGGMLAYEQAGLPVAVR